MRKLAVAIELMHAATLLHDDVLDQDTLRRNALTVNAKWGIRDAILCGDALASLSLYLAADYGKEIIEIMSQTCLLLSDGEFMDVENAKQKPTESDYLETIRRKSASLFKAATECGAMAAGATSSEVNALAGFGESLGLAYQIKDDLQDLITLENEAPQDVNEFRATLPIIHLYKSVESDLGEALVQEIASFRTGSSTQKRNLLNKLRKCLQDSGTIFYCTNMANSYIDSAISDLRVLKESVYGEYLVQMAKSLRL